MESPTTPERSPELNFDVLLYIFRHLDGDDLAVCAMVCREWCAAADYLRRKKKYKKLTLGGTLRSEDRIARYHPNGIKMHDLREYHFYKTPVHVFKELAKDFDPSATLECAVRTHAYEIALEYYPRAGTYAQIYAKKHALKRGHMDFFKKIEPEPRPYEWFLKAATESGKLSVVKEFLEMCSLSPHPPEPINPKDIIMNGNVKMFRYLRDRDLLKPAPNYVFYLSGRAAMLKELVGYKDNIDRYIYNLLFAVDITAEIYKEILLPSGWNIARIIRFIVDYQPSLNHHLRRKGKVKIKNILEIDKPDPTVFNQEYVEFLIRLNLSEYITEDQEKYLTSPKVFARMMASDDTRMLKKVLDRGHSITEESQVYLMSSQPSAVALEMYLDKRPPEDWLISTIINAESRFYSDGRILEPLFKRGLISEDDIIRKVQIDSRGILRLHKNKYIASKYLEWRFRRTISPDNNYTLSPKIVPLINPEYINEVLEKSKTLELLGYGGGWICYDFLKNYGIHRLTPANRKKLFRMLDQPWYKGTPLCKSLIAISSVDFEIEPDSDASAGH